MDHATYCAEVVRKFDYPRYLSVLYAPREARDALMALYAFSSEIARVRELVREALPGEMRLQWWRDTLAGQGHGSVGDNPVAAALLQAIDTHDLPVEALLRLIDARVFDLYNDPMPSQQDLEGYAGETSSVLLQLASLVLNRDLSGRAFADACGHGGVAYAMVGLVRALPWHAARQQCFLPKDLLEKHGVSSTEMFRGNSTPELTSAVEEFLGIAQIHYGKAQVALKETPSVASPAFLVLTGVPAQLNILTADDVDYLKPGKSESPLKLHWTYWKGVRALKKLMA
ncbi:phytoene/squalene synthase family protein [Pseudovibrio sp. SPO723]|uniref:phytoene/squalene synthase family protein n=1 Tax=Nesiotobacter zosterae TaxID=392721 RepID=UPI0029C5D1AD|nr:phytoene/squalene synthase family protein [Pseudovibrio sp. SPO723]MDX5592829.1 phytoene/squalene synthase family protein [Pseudovibrio sp. SPO723]